MPWLLTLFVSSPLARALALIALGLVLAGGLYLKISHDAVAAYETKVVTDQKERIKNAVKNGDATGADGPDGMRGKRWCRDCGK